MYLIFSLSVSSVMVILVMLNPLKFNGLIAKLSSFLGSFKLSLPFIIFKVSSTNLLNLVRKTKLI